MGSGAVRAVRGRAGAAVPRAGGPGGRPATGAGGGPRLRGRRADGDTGRALAGARPCWGWTPPSRCWRRRPPAGDGTAQLRARDGSRTGDRPRRWTCSSRTPHCTGCRATRRSCARLAAVGRAGRLAGRPAAGQRGRAVARACSPSCAGRRGGGTGWAPGPAGGRTPLDPADYVCAARAGWGARSTRGRRRTRMCCPGRTRCSTGCGGPRCGPCWRSCRRPRRRSSRPSTARPAVGLSGCAVRHGVAVPTGLRGRPRRWRVTRPRLG